MKNIKPALRLWYLSLLRFRLEYAVDMVWRGSRIYQAVLSRAFWMLSLWECEYQRKLQRHFAAIKEEQPK